MSTVAPVRGLTELASLGSKRWQQTKSDLQIGGIAEGDTVELQNLDEKIKSLLSREEEAHEPLLAMEPITAQRRGSQFQDEKDEEILWNFEQQTGSENAVRGGFSCVKDTGIDPLYSEELLVIDMLRVLQERGPEAITSSAVDTERFLGSVKEFSSRGVLDRMSEGGEGDVEFFWDTVFEVAGRLPKASMSPAAAARHFLCNALRRLETMHIHVVESAVMPHRQMTPLGNLPAPSKIDYILEHLYTSLPSSTHALDVLAILTWKAFRCGFQDVLLELGVWSLGPDKTCLSLSEPGVSLEEIPKPIVGFRELTNLLASRLYCTTLDPDLLKDAIIPPGSSVHFAGFDLNPAEDLQRLQSLLLKREDPSGRPLILQSDVVRMLLPLVNADSEVWVADNCFFHCSTDDFVWTYLHRAALTDLASWPQMPTLVDLQRRLTDVGFEHFSGGQDPLEYATCCLLAMMPWEALLHIHRFPALRRIQAHFMSYMASFGLIRMTGAQSPTALDIICKTPSHLNFVDVLQVLLEAEYSVRFQMYLLGLLPWSLRIEVLKDMIADGRMDEQESLINLLVSVDDNFVFYQKECYECLVQGADNSDYESSIRVIYLTLGARYLSQGRYPDAVLAYMAGGDLGEAAETLVKGLCDEAVFASYASPSPNQQALLGYYDVLSNARKVSDNHRISLPADTWHELHVCRNLHTAVELVVTNRFVQAIHMFEEQW
ncbi:MAG: hypothetical protein KVP17_002159 [Porospora cf. gigantea B]|uniref:uncharacterized protein n=1 Tax=Porospora cf. gigantea B TaxID=2853592 RepID=UPI003571D991|nr:MAG: hypothetical protein KVP17_002159 [Porospora cf. gigantea B]